MTSRPAYQPPVRADDPLPTAEAVALAKGLAARACAARAAEIAWPSTIPAVQWIDRIPLVALAVLEGLCPEVAVERLASCLGLDPSTPTMLESWRRRPSWAPDLVAAIVQQVRG